VCCAVIGGGGTALRDFISDAVGNATQDANYKGFYLPFYTVGTGAGARTAAMHASSHCLAACFPTRGSHRYPLHAAGQQYFLNNTFQYAVGDFPLGKRDFEAAFR
jgi:hypothetical protein